MVTATTVGYGDKVTDSIPGKIIMIVWMFLGTYFMSVFQVRCVASVAPSQTRASLLYPKCNVCTRLCGPNVHGEGR